MCRRPARKLRVWLCFVTSATFALVSGAGWRQLALAGVRRWGMETPMGVPMSRVP